MKKTDLLIKLALIGLLFWNCNREDDNDTANPNTPTGPIELLNSSFETQDGSSAADWFAIGGPYSAMLTTEESLNGGASVEITSEIGNDEGFGFWGQSMDENIQPGKKLTLNVNIKLEEVAGEGVAIAIRGDDTPVIQDFAELFTTTQGDLTIVGTHNWKTYSVTLEEPIPSSIQVITVYLIMLPNTSGSAWFDDVELFYE